MLSITADRKPETQSTSSAATSSVALGERPAVLDILPTVQASPNARLSIMPVETAAPTRMNRNRKKARVGHSMSFSRMASTPCWRSSAVGLCFLR